MRSFLEALGEDAPSVLRHTTIAAIGPITADTARTAGLAVAITAETYTIEGLVQSLIAFASEDGVRSERVAP